MHFYIADPNNPKATALLKKHTGMRPDPGGVDGPWTPGIFAVIVGVVMGLLFWDHHYVWGGVAALVMVILIVFAVSEYEPIGHAERRQFDAFVARGVVVGLPKTFEAALMNHRALQNMSFGQTRKMLAHNFVPLRDYVATLVEIEKRGELKPKDQRELSARIRRFIGECARDYKQHLAAVKAGKSKEQDLLADWTRQALPPGRPE